MKDFLSDYSSKINFLFLYRRMWPNSSVSETLSLFSWFSWDPSVPLQWWDIKVLSYSLNGQHCYLEGAEPSFVMPGPWSGSICLTSCARLKGSWKTILISNLWKPGKKKPNLYIHHFPIRWETWPRGKGNGTGMGKRMEEISQYTT